MEPERPIEKALREVARRRREQMREPLELHPATRRLLQTEVSRSRGGRREGAWIDAIFRHLRPRLVFALCVVGLLAFCAIVLLPILHQSETSRSLASRRGDLRVSEVRKKSESPPPASMPAAVAPGPATWLPDQEAITTARVSKALQVRPAPETPPVVVTMPELAKDSIARRESTAANRDAQPSRTNIAGGIVGTAVELAETTQRPVAPAESVVISDKERGAEVVAQAAKIDRLSEPAAMERSNARARGSMSAAVATAAQPVLRLFSVQRQGDQIRFFDSDGSVYRAVSHPTSTGTLANVGKPVSTVDLAAFSGLVLDQRASGVQTYPFVVAGSNRTLGQWIIFAGSFSNTTATSAIDQSAAPTATAAAVLQAEPQNLPWLSPSNWTLTGTAIIAGTNRLDIHATSTGSNAFWIRSDDK